MARVAVVCRTMAASSLAMLLATVCPTPVVAQRFPEVAEGDRIRVMVRDLSDRPFYRPALGIFAGATADTIYLRGRDSLIAFHRQSVGGVEVSAGRATYGRTGAIVGATLGAAVGVGGVVVYCGGEDCETAPQAALMYGAAFAAAGAAVGALIGHAIPGKVHWIPAEVRIAGPVRR